jgi:hypothetical protein
MSSLLIDQHFKRTIQTIVSLGIVDKQGNAARAKVAAAKGRPAENSFERRCRTVKNRCTRIAYSAVVWRSHPMSRGIRTCGLAP